jgi:hypothetical protein
VQLYKGAKKMKILERMIKGFFGKRIIKVGQVRKEERLHCQAIVRHTQWHLLSIKVYVRQVP